MILAKNRHTDQWNRKENLEINPQLHGQSIFVKGGMSIQWEMESVQQMVLGKLDRHMEKNEAGSLSFTIYKNKLKMDQRLKCKS